eukprot:2167060-Prymnesium_polylepis.2
MAAYYRPSRPPRVSESRRTAPPICFPLDAPPVPFLGPVVQLGALGRGDAARWARQRLPQEVEQIQ